MAKHHKKDDKAKHKAAKTDKKEPGAAKEKKGPGPKQGSSETYSDGHPRDRVEYIEVKLILKPDRFVSVESFRDFGKIVRRTAKHLGVGFVADPKSNQRPEIREIVFFDTPDFRLYNNAFILRRRISYVDGFASGDPEMVFKFRHPDEQSAAAVDVRPNIAGKYRIKFKAEILPLKDQIGGFRILYSHNCQFGQSQMHDADRTAMKTLGHVFQGLASLEKTADEKVGLVNEGIVEEVLLPLGQLEFGKGVTAKSDVALWRTRGEHQPLVGEFSFQVKFERERPLHRKTRDLVEQFYVQLQYEVQDWIALGATKTAMVYRLKGNAPQSHE